MTTNSRAHRGSSTLVTLLLFALILGAAFYGGRQLWLTSTADSEEIDAILHTVERDDFLLEVTERGEIKSSGVTEIRSEVKAAAGSGVAIMRIIPEGTEVKEGDFLVELDATALKADLTTQKIACNSAEALVIEANNLYQTALIAKREYLEGTYVQERQTIESEVFVAEENLNRAKEYYEYSKKLATKGYVNDLQLEADKFAVEKSQKELEAAKTKLKVLDEFTKAKTLKQLESDILIAKAKWEANQNSYQLELDNLKEIEDQLAKCTIKSPKEGIVMYAHERDRRGNADFIVEEGASVRERQAIIRIPDSTSMQVEITINESLIQFVKKGMPAKITPVGMGDMVLRGTVEKVNRYAEPTGWRRANVKEYKAFVTVDDPPSELRSGLTASVTIECAFVPDTLVVPVQGVYAHGDKFFCMVYHNKDWEAKEVVCGPTNDKFFVIETGLDEGDQVALNPRRYLSEVSLPELPPEKQQLAVPLPSEGVEDFAADGMQRPQGRPNGEGLQQPAGQPGLENGRPAGGRRPPEGRGPQDGGGPRNRGAANATSATNGESAPARPASAGG